ncbi:hypothetical protein BDN72DRAFT_833566 [Pluteus cervinus]|uniref:Uncharacterized protein n=1 Tax=Pluteus cervinus TaxID=181527 RepID=A0ACD3B7F2_9AGAR|nr:hypothetical protein BDN72DRAFT_833566 [Pluteus cervinus]
MNLPIEVHDPALAAQPGDPLARYKNLPEGFKEGNHYWFYGWAVSDEDMKRCHEAMNVTNYPGPYSDWPFYAWTLRQISVRSGYEHISLVLGEPDKKSYEKAVTVSKGEKAVKVFALSCSKSNRLFWTRPTEKQLERLIKIFGEEPRWIMDFQTKREFCSDWMQ